MIKFQGSRIFLEGKNSNLTHYLGCFSVIIDYGTNDVINLHYLSIIVLSYSPARNLLDYICFAPNKSIDYNLPLKRGDPPN